MQISLSSSGKSGTLVKVIKLLFEHIPCSWSVRDMPCLLYPQKWVCSGRVGYDLVSTLMARVRSLVILTSLVCKSSYRYFKFIGRHNGFSTSGLVVQCSKCFRWIAGPRKHEGGRWDFVSVGGIEPEIRWGGIFTPKLQQ